MLPKFKFRPSHILSKHGLAILLVFILLLAPATLFGFNDARQKQLAAEKKNQELTLQIEDLQNQIEKLQSEDLRKTNTEVRNEINSLKNAFGSALVVYEDILKIRDRSGRTGPLETLFASILNYLNKDDLKNFQETLNKLSTAITTEENRLNTTAAAAIPANVVEKTAPPESGYSRQKVTVDGLGSFLVDVIAADLSSTKVIVDTASDSTCTNDCPVMPLASYVSRSGAYAGVNGSYFCPASYPSCTGKTNSFDLLVMNKNKTYLNSDNNVYSNNPGVIFGNDYIRFVGRVSDWGRDTSINGMLSNFPLLVSGKNVAFGGDSDPKQGSKGNRSFVANQGNRVYIGVVHSVTTAESARVLAAMGMDNALNLDDGGSTALWSGGYKVGPGRDLPNVILFVRK